ncbi:hypothetical protein Astex_1855 [Asticcacaulis excentricus CB 48]|uniref:Uncharacterized protein n=1 Tax=Asticcacaulis excentricus (strain ATCC 15261 / DSM 4724 / KCTC 12464 / NCIMB 9791 / VKM B-1370 / CB 48) TaxID=573065 RepID=E8RRZ4_ASTEC|nr:hypothetical protein Astex_1855 [Asticcacaulis excentricus CB 48]
MDAAFGGVADGERLAATIREKASQRALSVSIRV